MPRTKGAKNKPKETEQVKKVLRSIPAAPVAAPVIEVDEFQCCYCGDIQQKQLNFCPACGQKLNWGE
jgi:membrane protease subunit (stomatin/prohibitin family)